MNLDEFVSDYFQAALDVELVEGDPVKITAKEIALAYKEQHSTPRTIEQLTTDVEYYLT